MPPAYSWHIRMSYQQQNHLSSSPGPLRTCKLLWASLVRRGRCQGHVNGSGSVTLDVVWQGMGRACWKAHSSGKCWVFLVFAVNVGSYLRAKPRVPTGEPWESWSFCPNGTGKEGDVVACKECPDASPGEKVPAESVLRLMMTCCSM